MYNHCRSRLLALGCDTVTSSIFQQLTKGDLNTSTAILQPNEPGSTNLRLSWLWHNARVQTGVVADASQFWECKIFHAHLFSSH
jgi:hypothetical protein